MNLLLQNPIIRKAEMMLETSDEVHSLYANLSEHLFKFAKKHGSFSFKIDYNLDNNTINVKTFNLGYLAN